MNQIEVHPYLTQDELRAFDAEHEIATEAWSPIAQGKVLDDPTIVAGRRAARQDAGAGDAALARPARRHRLPEVGHAAAGSRRTSRIFDFELGRGRHREITALDRDERTGPDPDTFNYVPR